MPTGRGILIGATLILLSVGTSFGDEIQIPFPIRVEPFKAEAKERGLDLYDQDGFVENRGGEFKVFTYHTVTPEQLELIQELTWKHLRK